MYFHCISLYTVASIKVSVLESVMKWQLKSDKLLTKICIMKLVMYDYYYTKYEKAFNC